MFPFISFTHEWFVRHSWTLALELGLCLLMAGFVVYHYKKRVLTRAGNVPDQLAADDLPFPIVAGAFYFIFFAVLLLFNAYAFFLYRQTIVLPSFGVLNLISVFFIWGLIGWRLHDRLKFTYHQLFFIMVVNAIIAILGANLLSSIVQGHFPGDWTIIKQRGFTVWGIIISSGIYTIVLIKYFFKRDLLEYLDAVCSSYILMLFFGRLGCFLGGCCFGKISSPHNPMAIPLKAFMDATERHITPTFEFYQNYPPDTHIWATQLMTAGIAIVILIIAETLFFIKNNYNMSSGIVFIPVLFLYSLQRFVMEFIRNDSPHSIMGVFSVWQVFSLLMMAVSTFLFYFFTKSARKKEA